MTPGVGGTTFVVGAIAERKHAPEGDCHDED
jgi:hypothetical protein